MCLAIPMKILKIDGYMAHCASRGIEREVNCFMLTECSLSAGDYVMVHVGYAIQKVDPAAARLAWETDHQLNQTEDGTRDA